MNKDTSNLTIWDSSEAPPQGRGVVYCWNGHAELGASHSILRYAETHGERLRAKYLAWIHDLGEHRIDGRRLIDHLALGDGLSYWWMTLLVEKSPYKSPITDAFRLLALDEIVVRERPGSLRLVSASRLLNEAMSGLCGRLNIKYEWKKPPKKLARKITLRDAHRTLPQPVQALIALARHVWVRWPLTRADKSGWLEGNLTLFFCSYFVNVDPKAAEDGHFHSYYWGDLNSHLRLNGYHSNWLQVYVPGAAVKSPRVAVSWARQFNYARKTQGFHTFVDAHLSWGIVLSVIKRWLWLNLVAWRLREIKHAFRPTGTQISLWPHMCGDWKASLCGASAVGSLLAIELLNAALRDLPRNKKGFYLCENQGWERALIHAWRKHGHGRLIAVAHSTVRFWDMRYFSDSSTVRQVGPCPMPQPDLIALNGQVAVDAYLGAGYPKEAIVECEALRYGHLSGLKANRRPIPERGRKRKVLVLGDVMTLSTDRLLKLLGESLVCGPDVMSYDVKPHPNCPVRGEDYPSLDIDIVTDPLGTILRDYDVAYCSNSTSAAVDAYFFGLSVVVMLDEAELNFSPLRDWPGVRFVSTPKELAVALRMEDRDAAVRSDGNDFFFLDPELPRWSLLLAN